MKKTKIIISIIMTITLIIGICVFISLNYSHSNLSNDKKNNKLKFERISSIQGTTIKLDKGKQKFDIKLKSQTCSQRPIRF